MTGVAVGHVEDPLVVLDGAGRLDNDGPGHPVRGGLRPEMLGQHGAVEELVVRRRPGHALGPAGIVEVGVGVDDHGGPPFRW